MTGARLLGLLGGMSWESTASYYRLINAGFRDRTGPAHSAPLVLWSFDFAAIAALQTADRWDDLGVMLGDAARRLVEAGADRIMICSNTMHRVAPAVASACGVPLLHIGDATGAAIRAAALRKVGLIGTTYTMTGPFLRDHLARHHDIEVIVPDASDQALIHRVIFDELIAGRIEPASRAAYTGVIARLAAAGAEAVILGCTEIGLLIGPQDSPLPLFDTAVLHAEAALAALLPEPVA